MTPEEQARFEALERRVEELEQARSPEAEGQASTARSRRCDRSRIANSLSG